MYEIREIKHKAEYNPLLISKQAPFTQAWFYGEWQELMGRKVRRFEIKKEAETIGFFQVIKYPLALSKNFLYIPHGPVLTDNLSGDFWGNFKKEIIEIAKEECMAFLRFDSFPPTGGLEKYFEKVPEYAYHSVYFQPKYEWVLDIDKPESELLGNMHPKNRYNIRLAENKGVIVEIVPLRGISRREKNNFEKYSEDFYSLMERTAKRNNFKLHPKVYYRNIFKNCEENKNAFLILAKYDDPSNKIGASKILAANLILLFGETAYFIFGGSSDEYKNLMAPHLAHWKGILEAKRRNYTKYNFGAVDAANSSFGGFSRFKKGFGGRLLEYSDSYDLVLSPVWYWFYNLRKWLLNQKFR